MRPIRWLILATISVIVVTVGATYYGRMTRMRENAPGRPEPLKSGIDLSAEGWHVRKTDHGRPIVEVKAQSFKQVKEPSSFELEGVELKLFHEDGQSYDLVETAKASYDEGSGVLYSEGQVKITRGVTEGADLGRLVKIVSSGVHFETKTGKAYTDRLATFTFERGDGKSVGADYDPTNRQLHMKSEVELNLRGKTPDAPATKVQSGDLVYLERDAKVVLTPWAKLFRGTLAMESEKAVVTLNEGVIRQVDADKAHGVQDDPGRKVEYSAEQVHMDLNDDGVVENLTGERSARLVSTTDTGRTDITSDRVNMTFVPGEKDSVLQKAIATGHAVVNSQPVVKPGTPPGDTRILKSETLELRMRPDGREIDNVETQAAGTLEFVPNRPGQPHRFLNGDHFWIKYGSDNAIESFRAVNAKTRTENPPKAPNQPNPPVFTSSQGLLAHFDPKTHQMDRLEQTTDFKYEEGGRHAQSDKATLDQAQNLMTLIGRARVLDPTGSTTADVITMNQKSGEFKADGKVASTRMPDKKGQSSAMLSNDEPLQAKADHMTATDNHQKIRYTGHAVAWQGGNRLIADMIAIDRDAQVVNASGNVVSQFVDKPKKDKDGKPIPAAQQQSVFTMVRAPEMTYTDEDRLAYYRGGVVLNRPNMSVKAREIKAYLKDSDDNSDSSLDHAFATGQVVIVQSAPDRTRTGTGEHAEYYIADDKVILEGGQPKMVDSLKGTTMGKQLTYFSKNDRLLVNGVEQQHSESVIRRK
jgi:lipopolysaccharide export system protein LptA